MNHMPAASVFYLQSLDHGYSKYLRRRMKTEITWCILETCNMLKLIF